MRRNQRLVQQLGRMRTRHWSKSRVTVTELDKVERLVERVIAAAEKKEAPVILFPFGPKPVIYEIGYLLARGYPEASWFVYPVPVEYDVNYTFDIDDVLWFEESKE